MARHDLTGNPLKVVARLEQRDLVGDLGHALGLSDRQHAGLGRLQRRRARSNAPGGSGRHLAYGSAVASSSPFRRGTESCGRLVGS